MERHSLRRAALKPVREQVVAVIGASSGIGRETARRLAALGAKVVVSARNASDLATLVAEIRAGGGEATALTADVSDFAQIKAVADAAVQTYGGLDTWVQLAAVGIWGAFEKTSPAEFKRVIDVNLTGQAYGAMAALPHLRRAGRGALIYVSSGEAKLPLPLQSAYVASKHGLLGLLDTLRMELAHDGVPISVTNIMPSSINTPFFEKASTKLGVMPRPLPPIYQPQLVADAIVFAATHRKREIIVGGAGAAGILARRLSPRLVDAVVSRIAFALQRTQIPKPADAPNNLVHPLTGYGRVEGPFGGETRSSSLFTALAMRPRAIDAMVCAGLAAGALMLARRRRRALREPAVHVWR